MSMLRKFCIIAYHEIREDWEVYEAGLIDMSQAHYNARKYAQNNPGVRYFIVETLGYHEAAVTLPVFVSLTDRPTRILPRLTSRNASEDLLS